MMNTVFHVKVTAVANLKDFLRILNVNTGNIELHWSAIWNITNELDSFEEVINSDFEEVIQGDLSVRAATTFVDIEKSVLTNYVINRKHLGIGNV